MALSVSQTRVEPATIEDLEILTEMVMSLLGEEEDFTPDRAKQEKGIRLILEEPSRGRIFVLRNDFLVIGMVNLLFTISTAEGGFVVIMEDFVIHPEHRRRGFGGILLKHVIDFAQDRGFLRITLLTDRISAESQAFFQHHGFRHSSMIPMRLTFPENHH
ncbi:MAG TPA: GNAT family N-acetyltransferase [Verrucomicrobiales bacterium]|nr:GNAT family N-acetyltransferase [Verrucomicrobiales bacterium]